MAAYGVLVSLSQTIDEILNHDGDSISHHQKERIKSIHEHVIFLQAFLEDFPEKVDTDLEGKIGDVSNEAEDVIERFLWKQVVSPCTRWSHRHDLDQLTRVAEKLDSIAGEAMDIKNSFRIYDIPTTVDSAAAAATKSSSSSSGIAPSHRKDVMVGIDDDLLAIKERLCGESSKLQVIPIVGMGGIGKTTLATNAYLDPLIIEYFQIRAWVTVSQDYSAQKVVSDLLFCMKEFNTERSDQISDELKVYQCLKNRRYLIVMDDVWSTQALDNVKRMFPDDNNGSRIMLTTRLSDVAAYADSSSRVHEMQLMDAEQSWDLLRRKVFTHEEECPLELENIGKQIAGSCRGLPLAIIVVAGLLSTRKTRVTWEEIARNIKSAINATKDGQFEKILTLSYTHLPHHLRPCFLYIGGFPEDCDIRVSKLIKLWVAEGFLKPSESKNSEEVAEEYLEDLVKRSLVLVNTVKSNGKIKSCSVHDLVWDLCVKKAKEVRLFTLVNYSYGEIGAESIKYQRRVYITRSDLIFPAYIGNSSEILRTIICFQSRSLWMGHLGNFKLLRILDVVDTYIRSLPVEVFKLYRLRYLALCNMKIPVDISNLQNLQTLIINPSKDKFYLGYSRSDMVCLPLEIWKQLRHLVSSLPVLLPFLEEAIPALENLVTLEITSDSMCRVGTFKAFPNLKKLKISYSEGEFGNDFDLDEPVNDYHLDELEHLHQLEKLTLIQGFLPGKLDLAFPKTLKKLTLSGWRLPWDGDVMRNVGSLPNLQVLKLRDCDFDGDKWETREGEFSQLKFLLIKHSNLKQWITESSHFPSLSCLLIHDCWNLSKIPDDIGEIPTLEFIVVKGYKRSLVESAKRIQEEQHDFGNDALQVYCFH